MDMYCVFALLQIPGEEDPKVDKLLVFSTKAEAEKKIEKMAEHLVKYFGGEEEKPKRKNGPVRVVYNGDITEWIYLKKC